MPGLLAGSTALGIDLVRTAKGDDGYTVQFSQCLLEAALAGLGGLGAGDAVGVPPLVAVREPVEGGLGRLVPGQRLCQLWRDLHRAGHVVQLDVDIDHVTAADPRAGTMLGAHAHHVLTAHDGDGVPVRVTVDRHPYRRALRRTERLHHLGRHFDAGCRLACRQYRPSEAHTSGTTRPARTHPRPPRP